MYQDTDFRESVPHYSYITWQLSYLGFAVNDALQDFDPSTLRLLRIIRLFRILRTFRIFTAFKGLYAIFETLMGALPAIGDLAVMLAVCVYVCVSLSPCLE